MNKNFLKFTLRNLWKNRLYSVIKIGGLGVGIATCLLVGVYLHHEFSYDAFHEYADRIVRTTMEYRSTGEISRSEHTGNKVGPSFKRDFPEVVDAVRVISYDRIVRYGETVFEETDIYYADSSFFKVFSFSLTQGNPDHVLAGPNKVVLTTSMARKYFGEEDPVGKSLRIGSGEYQVQGVMEDAPSASQMKPHFVASFQSLRDAQPDRATWWNANYATYLLLTSPEAISSLQSKIPDYMRSKAGEHGALGENYLTYVLEPLTNVHLRSALEGNFEPTGDIRYIYILGFASLIVLLIASITYVNLTTATSSVRAREIGVCKVIGATRKQLFSQYIGEAILATLMGLVLGFVIASSVMPGFSLLLQRELSWAPLLHPISLALVLGFSLVISFLAGVYPATVLSSYQPVTVLKGAFIRSKSGTWLRKSLVVAQFSISVFLMICTGILFLQLQYLQKTSLGYEKDQVLVLPADSKIVEDIGTLKSEFLKSAHIQSVSLTYETPSFIEAGYTISGSLTGENVKPVTALSADEDFVETTGLQLIAGTVFQKRDVDMTRRGRVADSLYTRPILINESQANALGWEPSEAIGQLVFFGGRVARVQGVIKDFHFASLHTPIDNLVVFPSSYGQQVLVRMNMQNVSGALDDLQSAWDGVVTHRPFSYHFLNEEVDQLYNSEALIATLTSAITGVAIFMTIIGLFGLAAITAQHRTKEVGVRKVLGASVMNIIGLLSSDLLKLTILAFVLSAPFAFFLMKGWLQGFAYHVSMPWEVFAGAGILAFAIAVLTVCTQSFKLIVSNPVEALRHD